MVATLALSSTENQVENSTGNRVGNSTCNRVGNSTGNRVENSTGCPLSWLPQLSSIMVTAAALYHGYRSCPIMVTAVAPSAVSWT